jgi:hypothetical protein
MKKFTFGYTGCRVTFWLNARSEKHLAKQLRSKGMKKPDWIDPVTHPVWQLVYETVELI